MSEMKKPGTLLPVTGAYNVRDMGGYPAANGRTVKWGRVYRSGDLHKLTAADLELFNRLGIKTFVDFRDDAERNYAPDKHPACTQNVHEFPIRIGNLFDLLDIDENAAAVMLYHANKSFVRDFICEYSSFFKVLMDAESAPLLFHCSAGKDRAGFAAAMFLSSLGVDRETVIQDYILSEQNIRAKYAPEIEKYPMLAPLMESKRGYLESAFETIDNEFGGTEKYLTDTLGADLDKLRSLYLD